MRWSLSAACLRRTLSALVIGGCLLACGADDGPTQKPRTVASVALLTRLSQHGVYHDVSTRTPARAALEYAPQYPLFSDFADKRRWLLLPPNTQVDTSDMDHWHFPLGTKAVKEFSRDGKPLETRLIQKVAETGDPKVDFFMGTFVWLPDGSDAVLSDLGVDNVNGTTHDVPKQELCLRCHQGEPGALLGFSALQLSPTATLATLTQQQLLSVPPKRTFNIPGNDLQVKALGVLQGNCAHCHTTGGSGALMRLRLLPHELDLPFELTEIFQTTMGRPLTDWTPRPAEFTRRLIPGDPDKSALSYRMGLRSGNGVLPDQMPPIATEVSDPYGLATVRAWIAAMPRDWVALGPATVGLDGGLDPKPGDDAGAVAPDAGSLLTPIDASLPAVDDAGVSDDAAQPNDADVPSADAAEPSDGGGTTNEVTDAGSADTSSSADAAAVPAADEDAAAPPPAG
jgi:hypothetical protein